MLLYNNTWILYFAVHHIFLSRWQNMCPLFANRSPWHIDSVYMNFHLHASLHQTSFQFYECVIYHHTAYSQVGPYRTRPNRRCLSYTLTNFESWALWHELSHVILWKALRCPESANSSGIQMSLQSTDTCVEVCVAVVKRSLEHLTASHYILRISKFLSQHEKHVPSGTCARELIHKNEYGSDVAIE